MELPAPPRLLTDFLAAVLASMSTALIEGPMDVFENRVKVTEGLELLTSGVIWYDLSC